MCGDVTVCQLCVTELSNNSLVSLAVVLGVSLSVVMLAGRADRVPHPPRLPRPTITLEEIQSIS